MAKNLKLNASYRCAGGWVKFFSHHSAACNTEMRFSVFVPPRVARAPVPVMYWLSGLTCTEENFMVKAGAQRYAAEHGIMLVAPDTSPRGLNLPGENDNYDFGTGAGFYVNATEKPWSANYQMYDYVAKELPTLINNNFPVLSDRKSISGHSMGGHGAMVVALRNPGAYRAVSAFSPICAPMQCPWGQKAFSGYLGEDESKWAAYDASTLLAEAVDPPPILIDQGNADAFLEEQLKPRILQDVSLRRGHRMTFRMHTGYDHGYYFVASFIGDHIAHHAEALYA